MDEKPNTPTEMKNPEDSDTVVSVDSADNEMDIDLKEDTHVSDKTFSSLLSPAQKDPSEVPADEDEKSRSTEVLLIDNTDKPGRHIKQDEIDALYESLAVCVKDPKNSGKLKGLRLEALHVRGVTEMSTDDVLEYFKEYQPLNVEWINDFSCNVVWETAEGAACALLALSHPVLVYKKGQDVPKPDEKSASDSQGDDTKTQNKEEVIMILDDSDDDDDDDDDDDVKDEGDEEENASEAENKVEKESSTEKNETSATKQPVDVSEEMPLSPSMSKMNVDDVDVPVPPGRWRLGIPCPKAKALLIRFATKVDKKARGAEKRSQYYLKHGNPNYGGLKGLISRSCKLRFRKSGKIKRPPPTAPVSNKRSRSPSPDLQSDPENKQEGERRQPGKHKKIRMRMYADDEEKRQKRRRSGASNPFLTTDLHSRLGKVPALKVSISSDLHHSNSESLSDSSDSNLQYPSVIKEVNQGASKNTSVWNRLELDENTTEKGWNSATDEEELDDDGQYEIDDDENDDDDESNWQGRVPDLRSKIGSAPRPALDSFVGASGGDLRNKLDKLRRDREIQKHRSPLLIQVTNDGGE